MRFKLDKKLDRRLAFPSLVSDIQKTFDINPNAFNCVLFKAQLDEMPHINERDVVGNIEAREETFKYAAPMITKAIELPSDNVTFSMLAFGADTDEGEEVCMMLIQESNVPEQSVLWIEEIGENETKIRLLYIVKAEPMGKNGGAGFKYHLMPFDMTDDFDFIGAAKYE